MGKLKVEKSSITGTLFWCVVWLLFCLTACGRSQDTSTASAPSPTAAPEPTLTPTPVLREYQPADCRFDVSEDSDIECGYLLVPEDRERPDSALIRVYVAVIPGWGEPAQPDPLVYLAGGPGGSPMTGIHQLRSQLSDSLQGRDLVVLDQRGVGFSEPSLNCPEYDQVRQELYTRVLDSDEKLELWDTAARACHGRLLAEGIDLSAYHSAAIAADVVELMQALGYQQYNLYGVSYGTRVALTLMRDHPAGLRGVVLDSVVPLQVNYLEQRVANGQQALALVFERCRQDTACQAAYPDLEEVYYRLLEELEQAPITVATGEGKYQVGAMDLAQVIFMSMYDGDEITLLPKELYRLDQGYTAWLAQKVDQLTWFAVAMSEGVNYSVTCYEERPFNSLEVAQAQAVEAGVPTYLLSLTENMFRICDFWESGTAGPIESQPMSSDLPVLILAGDYDPTTPARWATIVAADMSNAQVVEFLGVGHGVLGARRCAQQIMAQFVDAPGGELDTACLEALKLGFVTR